MNKQHYTNIKCGQCIDFTNIPVLKDNIFPDTLPEKDIVYIYGREDGSLYYYDHYGEEHIFKTADELNIIDNLDSDDPEALLSARQGKVLKELIESEVTNINESITSNINNINEEIDSLQTDLSNKVNLSDFRLLEEKVESLPDDVASEINDLKTEITDIKTSTEKYPDGAKVIDFSEDESKLVFTNNDNEVFNVLIPKGGGGGNDNVFTLRFIGSSTITGTMDNPVYISYEFISTDSGEPTGPGTVQYSVNNTIVLTQTVQQGTTTINILPYLNTGSSVVRVRVTDANGEIKSLSYDINIISLKLVSTFSDGVIQYSNPIPFRYTLTGTGSKTIHFILNGVDQTETVTSSGVQLTKQLTGIVGTNTLEVYSTIVVEGIEIKSNVLYYEFIYANGATQPIISSSYNETEIEQYSIINLSYMVYDPANEETTVHLYVNNELLKDEVVLRKKYIWQYQALDFGALTLKIVCGTVERTFNINVKKSEYDIEETTTDLEFKVEAIGKSNNSQDKATWTNNGYSTVFSNVLFVNDGWKQDSTNSTNLTLIGNGTARVGIQPFRSDILTTGLTLTIDIATTNVTNTINPIISCMNNNIGFEVYPDKAVLKSSQSSIEIRLDTSEKTSISFNIEKRNQDRLVYVYINGIASESMQYPNTDNFSQLTLQNILFSTGNSSCETHIYGIRWYKNNLSKLQILNNFIFDIENPQLKITKYLNNLLLDDEGKIDYVKAVNYIPCLTIIGDLPQSKGDKKTNSIIYENRQDISKSYNAENAQSDVQGTSSQYYPRKNYKVKYKSGVTYTESGIHETSYKLRDTSIPASTFTYKADFAESSGTHNTGMAVLIDSLLKSLDYLVPPQETDINVRTTVDGFPILIFHKQTVLDKHSFIGKYNFNDDKSSENVFGFTEGCQSFEYLNNTSDLCLFKSDDFSGEWTLDLEGRYPDGSEDTTGLQEVYTWVKSCIGNTTKFKAECANHFNVKWLLFYYLATEFLGMVDQRAKNQFITTYGERGVTGALIWYFIFYDNDTCLGINNEGLIAFDFDIEDQDVIGNQNVFNGANSELWKLVKAAYATEIQSLYQTIRQQQKLTIDSLLNITENLQADKWSEIIYNEDGYYKYIEPLLIDGNASYLYALQGSRQKHRIWWVTNRFSYMDSKYNAGSFLTDYATMRLYTPANWTGIAPNADFDITVLKSTYVNIKYGSYNVNQRGWTNDVLHITAPAIQFNDTETIIYGISSIKSLGDLSAKYLGSVDISRAVMLEDLLLGSLVSGYSNSNLHSINIGNSSALKHVNIANCVELNQALDLSNCNGIQTVEAVGSAITAVLLPDSGVLQTFHLPSTITTLILKNQYSLTDFTIGSYNNITSLNLENTPIINGWNVLKTCLTLPTQVLSTVRVIGIDATDKTATANQILRKLLTLNGIDDNGDITSTAVVTGIIRIGGISTTLLQQLNTAFPRLSIVYDSILVGIDFQDAEVEEILLQHYDHDGDGVITPTEATQSPFSVATNLFAGTNIKTFNEYYRFPRITGLSGNLLVQGATQLNEVGFTPSSSRYSDIKIFNDLPNLKKLTLHNAYNNGSGSVVGIDTVFYANWLGNCSSIETIELVNDTTLSSNYTLNAVPNQFIYSIPSSQTSRCPLLIFNGITNITLDPTYRWDLSNLGNSCNQYFGKDLKKVICRNAYYVRLNENSIIEELDYDYTYNDGSVTIEYNLKLKTLNHNNKINSNAGIRIQGNSSLETINFTFDTFQTISQKSYVDINSNGLLSSRIRLNADFISYLTVSGNANLKILILDGTSIPALSYATSLINNHSTFKVYVPDALVQAYKTTTNWNAYADKIFPVSELPA